MKFSVIIRKAFDDDKPMKAVASVTIDDAVAVHNVKVIKTDDKTFVAMPFEAYKNKDGKETRRDVVHPITSEIRKELEEAVITAYNKKVNAVHV